MVQTLEIRNDQLPGWCPHVGWEAWDTSHVQGEFSSVPSLSHVWLFVTPWTTACQASLSNTISWSLLKLMSIESVMPSNHLILCHPLFLLPPIFPSIRVFSQESALHIRWPKDWSFSFSISLSNEYSRLMSFRMDWLDLLAVQGTLKSLLQHHSLKASILWCSAWLRNKKSGFETQIQRLMMEHPPEFRETTTLPSRWSWVDFQTVALRASRGQSHSKANMDGQCVSITAERLKHFPGASAVKNLPALQEQQETWVWTLGQEDPPEEEMATRFTVLAWKIPVDWEAWLATVYRVSKTWTGLSH